MAPASMPMVLVFRARKFYPDHGKYPVAVDPRSRFAPTDYGIIEFEVCCRTAEENAEFSGTQREGSGSAKG